jgi:hypothetical protein
MRNSAGVFATPAPLYGVRVRSRLAGMPYEGAKVYSVVKAKGKSGSGASVASANAVKLSVNVSSDIGKRLRKVAFEERLSESSIVEIALEMLFSRTTDATVGKYLREHGASLRRVGR